MTKDNERLYVELTLDTGDTFEIENGLAKSAEYRGNTLVIEWLDGFEQTVPLEDVEFLSRHHEEVWEELKSESTDIEQALEKGLVESPRSDE